MLGVHKKIYKRESHDKAEIRGGRLCEFGS